MLGFLGVRSRDRVVVAAGTTSSTCRQHGLRPVIAVTNNLGVRRRSSARTPTEGSVGRGPRRPRAQAGPVNRLSHDRCVGDVLLSRRRQFPDPGARRSGSDGRRGQAARLPPAGRTARSHRLLRGTTSGLDLQGRSPLRPPGRTIISASMAATSRSAADPGPVGGRARYVHIGQALGRRGPASTSRSPRLESRCREQLTTNAPKTSHTLHGVTRQRLRSEAARWAPRLAHLPRPYVLAPLATGATASAPGNAARLGAGRAPWRADGRLGR